MGGCKKRFCSGGDLRSEVETRGDASRKDFGGITTYRAPLGLGFVGTPPGF